MHLPTRQQRVCEGLAAHSAESAGNILSLSADSPIPTASCWPIAHRSGLSLSSQGAGQQPGPKGARVCESRVMRALFTALVMVWHC
eukprot:7280287-Alexandrium_andersonii.AAC.1